MKTLRLILPLAALILGGCSTIDKYNPFSSTDPKTRPAELSVIDPVTARMVPLWRASIGKSQDYVLSPAVAGNAVYAASPDGVLARFDQGKERWRISVGQTLSGGVGADGKLVAVGTPKGEVLTFDAETGAAKWKARVSSEVLAAPVLAEGMVVVRSGDSHIAALEAADGKRRWIYQRATPSLSLRSSVGVLAVPGGLLAGFPGGKVVALALNNGAVAWETVVTTPKGATELERMADITSLPQLNDRHACAVAFQGRVACFDAAGGNTVWSRDISSLQGLDMDGRAVYVSDDKGAVQAYDRNSGSSLWRQAKLTNRQPSRPLVIGGYVAVGDVQGWVHLLRRDDGAFGARIATDGSPIVAPPTPLGNGLLVQTRDGGLFAFGIE
ncbi:outer membrane protein assembly factor BamB [Denitratisoma oestradiolicum]|uniref:Outer membrane protein assembly factor BamB n=1 Tax=Denitratisoma oestradiolicum TaxID=311182 RepID=A0A6S6XZR5_9PROT|nr:outer membrane protein assembly factor BamB [Denitratisoma oestradiolicum]TWO78994.1 outer membrane protein assembly factor BamB [Denitratisoma oestradiolicum]CAB1369951.1 Outer membrane protein assembly factor BamB [Denitratisoma oestradiolicum]